VQQIAQALVQPDPTGESVELRFVQLADVVLDAGLSEQRGQAAEAQVRVPPGGVRRGRADAHADQLRRQQQTRPPLDRLALHRIVAVAGPDPLLPATTTRLCADQDSAVPALDGAIGRVWSERGRVEADTQVVVAFADGPSADSPAVTCRRVGTGTGGRADRCGRRAPELR
jgi:hypothetical protein